ncbi:hypothetical protein, partial [Mesorhizobium japonicum]|uniref:hypothetical protein n=1 Tax=Mesorhizobium japonicum TaxID=2066070 RepID=UPI003B5C9A1A
YRAANERRSLYGIPIAVGAAVSAAVLLRGAGGGAWAGAVEMFVATALFAALGFVETLRGWLGRSLNARIAGIGSLIMAMYYLLRTILFVTVGVHDPVFEAGFSPTMATLINLGIVVVGSMTISMLQAERFRRPGLAGPSDAEAAGLLSGDDFRVLAETWLRRALRDRATLALLLVELANIDEINLAFGRLVGDNAIRLMGRLAVDGAPAAAL